MSGDKAEDGSRESKTHLGGDVEWNEQWRGVADHSAAAPHNFLQRDQLSSLTVDPLANKFLYFESKKLHW